MTKTGANVGLADLKAVLPNTASRPITAGGMFRGDGRELDLPHSYSQFSLDVEESTKSANWNVWYKHLLSHSLVSFRLGH